MLLSERREALNLTQREVAERVGVSQANICNYEAGNYKPKYPTNQRLAELYGCTIEEIMEGGMDNGANAVRAP